MSSPNTTRAWDIISPGPSNYQRRHSISRRSTSSIRRSRAESISSVLYDPDTYTDDIIPQDVIFDGPSSSSVPTSISNFAHRGSRTSFADEERATQFFAVNFDSDAEEVLTEIDFEEEERHSLSSSRISEASYGGAPPTPEVERGDQLPLIHRRSTDQRSDTSATGKARVTQKVYLVDEDMVVVISGFRMRESRLWVYGILSILSCGMVYLILQWLPRWRLRLLAEPAPLSEARWVVVEVVSV